MMEIDPLKTWAIVAGVEKYEAGKDWNLNGPVNDAARFVRWLRGRGVPAGQILLHLSPLDDNQEIARCLNEDPDISVGVLPANEQAIKDSFDRVHGQTGEMFYVFLGGHGAIHRDERLFFYSEARPDRLENLNLDQVINALRTDHYSGFCNQAIFIDACAGFFDASRAPRAEFARGNPAMGVSQFVFHAAADGQPAFNDNIERTGYFSSAILDVLENDYGAGNELPDFDRIAAGIKERFSSLESIQRPVSVRYRSGIGDKEEYDLCGTIIGAGERFQLLSEVRAKSKTLDLTTADWKRLYRQTARYLRRQTPDLDGRDEIFSHLYGHENRHSRPLLELLWRAARKKGDDEIAGWVEQKIDDRTVVADLKERFEREPEHPHFYLLVELSQSASTNRDFAGRLDWWLWDGVQGRAIDKGCLDFDGSEEEAGKAVAGLIQQLQGKYEQTQLHLEFLVVRDHLGLPFDQWEYRYSPLGANFPLAVRPSDRPKASAVGCRDYVAKIRRLQGPEASELQWLPDQTRMPLNAISPHFNDPDRCCSIFGFSKAIDNSSEEWKIQKLLIECGAPFMIWPREFVRYDRRFREKMDKVASAGRIDRFPIGIRDYRSNSPDNAVTLFWDDPERVPVRGRLSSP